MVWHNYKFKQLFISFKIIICIQFSPSLSSEDSFQAHHILVYHCDFLEPETLASGGSHCEDATDDIKRCFRTVQFGGWAVGGVVSIWHTFKLCKYLKGMQNQAPLT